MGGMDADLVVKVRMKTSAEDVSTAIMAAADGPSDFMQTHYSNSVDSALTMVMGEDLVKVVLWYDYEWGLMRGCLVGLAPCAACAGATESVGAWTLCKAPKFLPPREVARYDSVLLQWAWVRASYCRPITLC